MTETPTSNSAAGQAQALAIRTEVEKGPEIDRMTAETGESLRENLTDLASKAEAVRDFGDRSPGIDPAVIRSVVDALTGITYRLDTLRDSIADIKQGKAQLKGQSHEVQNGVSLRANTCSIIARELLTTGDASVSIPTIPGPGNFESQLDLLGFYLDGVSGYHQVTGKIAPEKMVAQKAKMFSDITAAAEVVNGQAIAYARTKQHNRAIQEKNCSAFAAIGVDARGRAWNLEITADVSENGTIRHGNVLHVYCGSVLKVNNQKVDYKGRPYDERNELQGLVHALQDSARGVVPTTPKLQ